MKEVKCIKGFCVEECDDDGFTKENSDIIIEEGTIWVVEDDDYRFIGGEIRLTNEKLGWLEISNEHFEDCFEIVG